MQIMSESCFEYMYTACTLLVQSANDLLSILLECNINEWTASSITVWGTINNVIEEQGIVKK